MSHAGYDCDCVPHEAPVVRWRGIAKVVEECGELTVELGKLMAYPNGEHPDAADRGPLLRRVENELADVLAAVEFFASENSAGLDLERIHSRRAMKLVRFRGWLMAGVVMDPADRAEHESRREQEAT